MKIIDVCCGSKCMWFKEARENKKILFCDIRRGKFKDKSGRFFEIKPDRIIDFRKMPFRSNSFDIVVMDPPHLANLSKKSWVAKKYGVLKSPADIKLGFDECIRILKPTGILIVKWSSDKSNPGRSLHFRGFLNLIGNDPLFGTRSRAETYFFVFSKQKVG